jgi:hypothetical protein
MNSTMIGKPAKPGEYHCVRCDCVFLFKRGKLECPSCKNQFRDELVPINVREQKEDELMLTKDDFTGG